MTGTDAAALVRAGLSVYTSRLDDGGAIEVRALDVASGNRGITVSGYFTDLDLAAHEITTLDGRGAVYVTINPVKPGVESRCLNRIRNGPKQTTGDSDIAARRSMVLDFDPKRPAGVSSTDSEHAAAIERAMAAAAWLREKYGYPDATLIDSGNGAHLVYAVDLPNDDASRDLVKRVLHGVALHFSDDLVDVDLSVFNAGRIMKVPGTLAIKGDNTADRPHRRSRVIYAPPQSEIVPREELETVAALVPAEDRRSVGARNGTGGSGFDLESYLEHHGAAVKCSTPWNGGARHILSECVFDPSHNGSSAAIVQLASGALAYCCRHASCSSRKWEDVRERFEPGYKGRCENLNGSRQAGTTNGSSVLSTADQVKPSNRTGKESNGDNSGPGDGKRSLHVRKLSDVQPERVQWLWANRIPDGKITLLVGDPGGGKSFASIALGANVTKGDYLPDDGRSRSAKRVVMWNGEDGTEDTIRIRAEACGADLGLFEVIESALDENGKHEPFGLHHLPLLAEIIAARGDVGLVIIDPVAALLQGVDSHRDVEVRSALQPLADLAKTHDVPVLVIMHLRKAEAARVLYRVGGSIGFVGLARSVLLVAEDQESGRRSISPVKHNLCAKPEPVEFMIDVEGVFSWGEVAPDLTAEKMLAGPIATKGDGGNTSGNRGKVERAADVIRAALMDVDDEGAEAVKFRQLGAKALRESAMAAGISEVTFNRAKTRMHQEDELRRSGGGKAGPVIWRLAASDDSIPDHPPSANNE